MRIVALPSARWLTERQPFFGLISGVPGEPGARFSNYPVGHAQSTLGSNTSTENSAPVANYFVGRIRGWLWPWEPTARKRLTGEKEPTVLSRSPGRGERAAGIIRMPSGARAVHKPSEVSERMRVRDRT